MVKLLRASLLFFSLPALATSEAPNSYEVGKMAQKANQVAQQKAARQKSEPDEMLKLLSTFEIDSESSIEVETVQDVNRYESATKPTENLPVASSASNTKQPVDTTVPSPSSPRPLNEEANPAEPTPVTASPSTSPDAVEERALGNMTTSEVVQKIESSSTPTAKRFPSSVYVPPASINAARGTSGRYGAVVRGTEYGILFGRWVRARIEREINSGDSGEVEIILEEDLAGKYRTIPAGTVIYANKGFNGKTRRLAIQTRRAVTPDNQVIPNIIASAFDNTRRAGLSGFIERNRDEVYQDAAGKALIELANNAVNAALPAELNGVSDVVADLESPQGSSVPYTIKVQPQSFWLRIDESL